MINLSDDAPSVRAMLEYLYKLDYSVPKHILDIEFHIHVYTIASKYNIPGLKLLAASLFKTTGRTSLDG